MSPTKVTSMQLSLNPYTPKNEPPPSTQTRKAAFGFAVLLILMASTGVRADTHYVWTNSPSPGVPYTSWTTAAHALQTATGAADLAIQSFDSTGRLTFNEISTATLYRVEWANAPTGTWHVGSPGVTGIVANGSGQHVVTVGVIAACTFYRVVALVTNVAPSGMVLIPAGTNSGTDPTAGAYSLTVTAFYMDATEVTKAEWDEVAVWGATNGYTDLPTVGGKAADHPVQRVSWYTCVKWCNAHSEKAGQTPCYTVGGAVYKTGVFGSSGSDVVTCDFAASGYRLPTVMEWEYAARGGLSGKRFPWGDRIDHTRANYCSYWPGGTPYYAYDDGYQGYDTRYATGGTPYTSPVGAFAANGYGLYDMAGNVWEWCWDASGSFRNIRGGSWINYADYARCRYSYWFYPDSAYDGIFGFRAVCR